MDAFQARRLKRAAKKGWRGSVLIQCMEFGTRAERADQSGPEQASAAQSKADQIRPEQARADQTGPDRTRPDQSRPDQSRPWMGVPITLLTLLTYLPYLLTRPKTLFELSKVP